MSRNISDLEQAVSALLLVCMVPTVLGVVMSRCVFSTATSAVFIMSLASFIPTQLRGP